MNVWLLLFAAGMTALVFKMRQNGGRLPIIDVTPNRTLAPAALGIAVGAEESPTLTKVNPVTSVVASPDPMKEILAKVIPIDWGNPDAIMEAADKAGKAGFIETAKALASTAQETREVKAVVIKAISDLLPSPIENITDDQWNKFVSLFRGRSAAEISPNNYLGLFNIGFLRLRELNLADDVKQEVHDGKPVWVGKLRTPMTTAAFLANPTLQYKVFAKDMKERVAYLRTNHASVIGTSLEDMPELKVSLSGLLGVIKLSGTKGFNGWISDAKQRAKFANTTAAFKAANGLF